MGDWQVGVCDVCKLVDGDERPKKVQHCGFCNANICSGCLYSTRRVQAFMKKKGLSIEGLKTWLAAQRV